MKLPSVFRAYMAGWKNFLGSVLYVSLWQVVLGLPLFPLAILVPDHLEGKAAGASLVRGFALAIMLLWVPLVSYKVGMLIFRSDIKNQER